MKKFVIAVLAMFAMATANAEISTSGLTEKQKAELALKAAEMKEQQESNAPVEKAVAVNDAAVEGVKKWTGIGAEVGRGLVVGLAAAAKEANIAVNDFATTPVGRITTAIIVWKLIGQDLLQLVAGLTLIFVIAPASWRLYNRLTMHSIEYEDVPVLWGLYQRRRIAKFRRETGDGVWTFCLIVVSVACVATGIILIV